MTVDIITQQNQDLQDCMNTAVEAGEQSKFENEDITPKCGVCLATEKYKALKTLSSTENEPNPVTALLSNGGNYEGHILFTTVGPDEKEVDLIVKSGIKTIYIGMFNPTIKSEIILRLLADKRINRKSFDPRLETQIEKLNRKVLRNIQGAYNIVNPSILDIPNEAVATSRRLDEWYTIINRIYVDRNYTKDPFDIFGHFVEIVGGLSVLTTEKTGKLIDPEVQIAKAVAWWFALNAKVGVRSVEDILFLKFPLVCPYCEKSRHDKFICNEVKQEGKGPNWQNLYTISRKNFVQKPSTLSTWQRMFYSIYPVDAGDSYDYGYSRFTEELGELAEAIRCLDISPSYFVSESADLFAWLMHLSNLYESKKSSGKIKEAERGIYLEKKLFELYPDKCRDCGGVICTCPPILRSTVGRISGDGPRPGVLESVTPFLNREEIAIQFGYGAASLSLGSKTFDATSDFIKTLRLFTENMFKIVQRLSVSDPQKTDKVSTSLQIVHSLAITQRVNQESFNRLIKAILNLEEGDRKVIKETLGTNSNDFIQSVIRNI